MDVSVILKVLLLKGDNQDDSLSSGLESITEMDSAAAIIPWRSKRFRVICQQASSGWSCHPNLRPMLLRPVRDRQAGATNASDFPGTSALQWAPTSYALRIPYRGGAGACQAKDCPITTRLIDLPVCPS